MPLLAASSSNGVGCASVVFVGGGGEGGGGGASAARVAGSPAVADTCASFLVPAAECERYTPAYLVEYSFRDDQRDCENESF